MLNFLVLLQVETTIIDDCSIRVFGRYIREYRSYFQWAGKFLAPPSILHCNSKGGSVAFPCNDFCSNTYTSIYSIKFLAFMVCLKI